MEIEIHTPTTRTLVIKASVNELADLYAATRRGRRTKTQNAVLEKFGDAIGAASPDVITAAVCKDLGVSAGQLGHTPGAGDE